MKQVETLPKVETVGELIKVLQKYPKKTKIHGPFNDPIKVSVIKIKLENQEEVSISLED